MWATGVLRENRPTRIDACDLWQPHQVLIASFTDLLTGALHPRRLLATAATHARPAARGLATVFGIAWVYALTIAVIATATLVQNQLAISPAAAIRLAALHFAPRMLLPVLAAAICVYPLIAWSPVVRIARPTQTQHAALLAAWVPAAMLWSAALWSLALLTFPDMSLGLPYAGPVVVGIPAWRVWIGRDRLIPIRATVTHRIVAVWALIVWLAGTTALATELMPDTLDPRVWPYVS